MNFLGGESKISLLGGVVLGGPVTLLFAKYLDYRCVGSVTNWHDIKQNDSACNDTDIYATNIYFLNVDLSHIRE